MRLPHMGSFSRITLERKLLFFFLLISSIPLLLINVMWSYTARNTAIQNRSAELARVAHLGAREIDAFIEAKLISLVVHSQTEAMLTGNYTDAALELHHFLLQDADIAELVLMDTTGREHVHVNREREVDVHAMRDLSDGTAFKVTTFVGGERYISPVYQDEHGEPMIDIAIPIVEPEGVAQIISQLSTSSMGALRRPGEIRGVLQSRVRVHSLASVLLRMRIGREGYVFVVDDKGTLVFHPRTGDPTIAGASNVSGKFDLSAAVRVMPEVEEFLMQSPQIRLPTEDVVLSPVSQKENEFGQPALTTVTRAESVHWGVVAQEPVSEVVADINRFMIFAFLLFLLFFILVLVSSFWFASQMIQPIKALTYGSTMFGSGYLHHRIRIATGDELEDLAHSFNQMAGRLSGAFATVIEEKSILSAERNKLHMILSGIRDPVIAVDYQRRIILFNRAAEAFSGLAPSQVIDRPIEAVMMLSEGDSSIPEQVYCPIRTDAYAGLLYQKQHLRVTFSGGQKKYADVIVNTISQGKEVNLGALITIHDVTAEQQLEEMKIDFVSMAAHELRTPLTAIRGYLELLETDEDAHYSTGQMTILSRIDLAATRLSALVQNLLNVSRIERGALTLALEQADWPSIVVQAVEELSTQAREKNIVLWYTPPADRLPSVHIDKLRMMEVLTNLITNAISYTPPGGRVAVRIELQDHAIVTHVSDTGQGIPRDALPHLFKKFFRVSGPLEQGSKGTGLGLYICREILTMHRGKIWVESEVGRGSTFSFSLPIV